MGSEMCIRDSFHDVEAMERLASRIVLMRDGRIEMAGHPEMILNYLTQGVRT